jgi:hypothetical protein
MFFYPVTEQTAQEAHEQKEKKKKDPCISGYRPRTLRTLPNDVHQLGKRAG